MSGGWAGPAQRWHLHKCTTRLPSLCCPPPHPGAGSFSLRVNNVTVGRGSGVFTRSAWTLYRPGFSGSLDSTPSAVAVCRDIEVTVEPDSLARASQFSWVLTRMAFADDLLAGNGLDPGTQTYTLCGTAREVLSFTGTQAACVRVSVGSFVHALGR
jgi:hypothetical protein